MAKTKVESLEFWADVCGNRMEPGHLAMLVTEFLEPYTPEAVYTACVQAVRDGNRQFHSLLAALESGAAGHTNAVHEVPGKGHTAASGIPGWKQALIRDRDDYALSTWTEYLQHIPDRLMLWDFETSQQFDAAEKARPLAREEQNAGD